jgi:uncharacterized protein DUF6513
LAETLFVTGRLAEPALRSVVSGLDIGHQIAVMNISVAALMTTRWIARRLEVPSGVDNIVIPGLCEGDVDALEQATGLPVRKGPADVRSLPEWYGCSRRSTTFRRCRASRSSTERSATTPRVRT